MKKLVIFGARNFAEMCHYFFSEDSSYTVSAFCVDGEYIQEDSFKGLPIVAFEELATAFTKDKYDVFVAMGIDKVNVLRAKKASDVAGKGYQLASFVSSKANTHDLVVPPNTMVMDYVNIHPFVTIGQNTIVWSNSRVALKTRIGNHCWITSAILGEEVIVGDYSFIGLNATIAPKVLIGRSNIIGAGSLIMKDTDHFAVYKGFASKPSRIKSNRLRNILVID